MQYTVDIEPNARLTMFTTAFKALVLAWFLSACASPGSALQVVQPETTANGATAVSEVQSVDSSIPVQIFRSGKHIDMMTGLPQRSCSFGLPADVNLHGLLALPAGQNVCALAALLLTHPDLSDAQRQQIQTMANNAVVLETKDMALACPGAGGCYSALDDAPIIPNPYKLSTLRKTVHEFCHGQLAVNAPRFATVGDISLSFTEADIVIFETRSAKASEILADLCQAGWTKWLSQDPRFAHPASMDYFEVLLDDIPEFEEADRNQLMQLRDQVDAASTWMIVHNTLVFFLEAMRQGQIEEALQYLGESLSEGKYSDPVDAVQIFAELVDAYGRLWDKYRK